MSTKNLISAEIPEAELQVVKDALRMIQDTLAPYLIALSPEQRRDIPKMRERTKPFVSKVTAYAVSDAQFVPPYLKVQEMKKDYNMALTLTRIQREVAQLESNLSDTAMLAGSEAYLAALTYYNSVKTAERMSVPGAKAIYEDLKTRFERPAKGKNTE